MTNVTSITGRIIRRRTARITFAAKLRLLALPELLALAGAIAVTAARRPDARLLEMGSLVADALDARDS